MIIDWAGVGDRLERLRGTEVFGAVAHGFELLPVLSEAEVAEAEGQFGVRLPDDYRSFLLRAGSGGAGPYYGLFPLKKHDDGRWGWVGDGGELTEMASLGRDFDPGDVSEAWRAAEAEEPGELDDEEAYGAWIERLEGVLWGPERTVGAICLCHQGCGSRNWLVVGGPHRGTVWQDHRVSDTDLAPEPGAGGLTFGRWYLNWLEAAEKVKG